VIAPTGSPFLLEEDIDVKNEFRCFFCLNPATSLAYYSKDYVCMNTRTIENPTLVCDECFDSPRIMSQISPLRGGMEGIYRFRFETIGKWDAKQLGYHLSRKGWEINHLATKPMRKLMWRIKFKNTPRREAHVGQSTQVSP